MGLCLRSERVRTLNAGSANELSILHAAMKAYMSVRDHLCSSLITLCVCVCTGVRLQV